MKRSSFVIPVILASALAGCGGGGGGTPPIPPTISLAGLPTGGKLAAVTSYALTVTETNNGQPVSPGTVTFAVDSPALGTVSGATLKTGAVNATGHVTATDAARGLSATIAVAVGSTHPATNGDTVAYTGTLTKTITRPLAAPSVAQPPYAFTYAVSIASTTSTGKAFAGTTGLIDFTTVETDTGSTPPLPVTTTDTFENFVPAAAGTIDVVSYGTQASDTNGSTYTTALASGNGLLDILPETNARTWHNTAAESYAEAEPDSTTIARAVNADGSYTETDTFADPAQPAAKIAVNPDLSGRYTSAPLPRTGVFDLTFGPPQGSGATAVILLTIVGAGAPVILTVPDWYPTPYLYSDAANLASAQTIPSACHVPTSLGTTASEIVESSTRLDPVLGTFETRRDVTYLVPFSGAVCTVLSDTLDDYYDYSGQSAQQIAAVPQQITTLAETVGFQSGSISSAGASVHAAGVEINSTAQAARTRTAIAVGRASFEHAVQRLYQERHRAMRALLRHTTSLQRMGR